MDDRDRRQLVVLAIIILWVAAIVGAIIISS